MSSPKLRRNPGWWCDEYEAAWDRVKDEFVSDPRPDLDAERSSEHREDFVPVLAQPTCVDRADPEDEQHAFRFGYCAHLHYCEKFSRWDVNLEQRLQKDWWLFGCEDWPNYREAVRQGWEASHP